jgi:16S rRNA (guanine527-N7)-methyltransferase
VPAAADERLRRWLEALVDTPGLTSVSREDARRVHVEDSLRAVEAIQQFEGPIVDVGSGGGAPGIPLAVALPEREVTLVESNRRKCEFLEHWARELPNVRVICGRAEELPVDSFGVALAKALAPPPVAAEWCLPLVVPGGAAILFAGPSAERERVARVAELLGGELAAGLPGLLVLRKLEPTPEGFPRRPGVARKRPLA